MSVANDVLKSAHEVPETPSPISVSHLQFRPAQPAGQEKSRQEKPSPRLTLPSLMFAFVLFTFLILGVLLLRTINHRIEARAATPAQSGVASGSDAATATQITKTPASTPTPAATTTPVQAQATASTTVQPAPLKPSPYKLQAVFFNPSKPSAIIAGKTVYVGDRVESYHITRINPTSVTLENGTQVRVLHVQ